MYLIITCNLIWVSYSRIKKVVLGPLEDFESHKFTLSMTNVHYKEGSKYLN